MMVLGRSLVLSSLTLSLINNVESLQSALPQTSVVLPNHHRASTVISSKYDDDIDEKRYIPETSFGSEAVPTEQRPVNEYLDVIRQPLFGWASEETGDKGLLTRLAIVYVVIFATVCYPIAGATYTQEGFELQKLAASNVGAIFFTLAVVGRIYSGWSYVGDRLTSKVIEYEETGWYDGQVELKTQSEKLRDQLLYEQNVKPAVERLRSFGLSVSGLCLASVLGLNLALSINPVFDEYDPALLERLSYDDKAAAKAAQYTGGRPAYCDSRYYRAVANGGQGCN